MNLYDNLDASEILPELRNYVRWLRSEGIDETDIRLQVIGDSWDLHTGDAQCDLDHHGHWGAGSIRATDSEDDLRALAEDLIDQVIRQVAEILIGQAGNSGAEDGESDDKEQACSR